MSHTCRHISEAAQPKRRVRRTGLRIPRRLNAGRAHHPVPIYTRQIPDRHARSIGSKITEQPHRTARGDTKASAAALWSRAALGAAHTFEVTQGCRGP
jgi:hypothetical protein